MNSCAAHKIILFKNHTASAAHNVAARLENVFNRQRVADVRAAPWVHRRASGNHNDHTCEAVEYFVVVGRASVVVHNCAADFSKAKVSCGMWQNIRVRMHYYCCTL